MATAHEAGSGLSGKRIVITSWGSFGDLYPYIGLALALRERGHHPVLAVPRHYRSAVEREGLAHQPVGPDVDPADRETVARIMDPRGGTEFLIRRLLYGSLRETHAALLETVRRADVLVSHPITFTAPIVAEQTDVPWVSTVLAPMSFFSTYDLPVFSPMPWAKRLERVPGAARALVGLARRITRSWSEPLYALRRSLGLPPGGDPIYEAQHSSRLVLGLFSRLLARPQPDWPANVEITGAIPYNGFGEQALAPGLDAFLAAGPPPVVFTLGTSAVASAGRFYEESAEAVRRLGVRAVLLAGEYPENRPRTASGDVFIHDFAPHAALFPRASAVVHQGGIGTLHQAMRAGRPTLIVPHAHDQPDNAFRVGRLGISRTLPPSRYTAGRVAREIGKLLAGPVYRSTAAAVAEQVRAEGGAHAACDAIERVIPSP